MSFLTKLFGGGASSAYGNLDIAQYEAEYFKQKNHVLVDVRTAGEYKGGHIPGAVNIPLDQLGDPQKLKKVPQDQTVVVVCASGNRSRSGAQKLVAAGYSDVFNLKGGTSRWRMAGKPVHK